MSWWETLHLVTWWKRLGISAIKTGQDAPSWIWCTERLSFFGGGHIVLQRFVHVRCHFQPLPTKLVFAYFDRGSYVQSMASFFQRFNIDDNKITETAKNQHKRLDCQTLQFFHVQIHCACQCIMTLPPKILWPPALLNTWTIITFPKSSFYHTNHTFLTSINVWIMDF